MYNRRVLAGEFTVVNKYLLRDLTERGLWTPEVRNQIIADQGSVQNVRQIPQELKNLYKTVWEIKQKFILNQVHIHNRSILEAYKYHTNIYVYQVLQLL